MKLKLENKKVWEKYHDDSFDTVMLDVYVDSYKDLEVENWADTVGLSEKAKQNFLSQLSPQGTISFLVNRDTGEVEIASAIG